MDQEFVYSENSSMLKCNLPCDDIAMELPAGDQVMRVCPLGKGISVHMWRDMGVHFSLSLLPELRIYKEIFICKLLPGPSPDMESVITFILCL